MSFLVCPNQTMFIRTASASPPAIRSGEQWKLGNLPQLLKYISHHASTLEKCKLVVFQTLTREWCCTLSSSALRVGFLIFFFFLNRSTVDPLSHLF